MFDPPPEPDPEVFIYRRETPVTSAITISYLQSWVEGKACTEIDQFFKTHKLPCDESTLKHTRDYAKHLYTVFWRNSKRKVRIEDDLLSTMEATLGLSCINWANCDLSLPLRDLNQNETVKRLYAIRKEWDKMIFDLSNTPEKSIDYDMKSYDVQFHFLGEHCVCRYQGRLVYMTWMMLLAFQDSIIGLFDSLVFSLLEDAESSFPIAQHVEGCIIAGIESILLLGEEVYDVLKGLHPAAVGLLIRRDIAFENDLQKVTLDDMEDCPLKQIFNKNPERVDSDIRLLMLSGIAKCFTYPVINIDESVENVLTKSKVLDPDMTGGNEALLFFRRKFCRTYLDRHKEWPPLRVTGRLPGDMQLSIETGTWQETTRHKWDLDEFAKIEIQECFELDTIVDETSILADKAISVGLSSWPREYDTRYHKLHYGSGCKPGPIRNRRLLIEHISRDEVNVFQDAMSFLKGDDWTTMMAVNCLKERELSRKKGRFFTKQTMKGRQYQALIEQNMKRILDYVPLTSMNLSGDALLKFLLDRSVDRNTAKMVVDFLKWCQYQRGALVGPIAREIDRILNCSPLFEMTHVVPLSLWWFFQDPTNIPFQNTSGLPTQGPRCTYGLHTMGEGMYQRLWTLVTGCGIMAKMYRDNLDCELMGSGDNQLLTCRIPSESGPRDIQMRLLRALRQFSEDAHLPIKLEETYIAQTYMEYGKNSFLNGKRIGQGLKRASRIGTESQETIPSINTKLSGIYATGIATASECSTPAAAYAVSTMEAGITLRTRGFKGTSAQLGIILLLGRQLGGFKTSPYASFCIRGINDTATVGASVMMTLRDHKGTYPRMWTALRNLVVRIGKVDWEQLFKDPYSIPYIRPRDADSHLRELVEEVLPSQIANKKLKDLLGSDSVTESEKLIETLTHLRPMSLKLGAAIYELSNVAVRERVLGQFHTSSSVLQLAKQHTSFAVESQEAKRCDKVSLDHLTSKGKGESKVVQWIGEHKCPTEVMDSVRCEVTGVDLTTPSAPAPQHQVLIRRWEEVPMNWIPCTLKVTVDDHIELHDIVRGNKSSYIGSDTKVKKHKSPVALISPSSTDRCALDLGELLSWVGSCPNLRELLTTMIREKTYSSPELVEAAADSVAGGEFAHRGQVSTLAPGAHINYDPSIMSYITINTDTATNFAKKGGDFTIMFQCIKIYVASWLIHRLRAGENVVGEWGAILTCPGCTKPIHCGDFRLDTQPTYQGFSLGTEGLLRFKRKGRDYLDAEKLGEMAWKAGHSYLAEKLVSSAVNYQSISLSIEISRVTEADDFALNPQASLTDLARCDVCLLFMAILQRIAIRPAFHDYLLRICTTKHADERYINPIRFLIDPIVASGRVRDLRPLLGSYTADITTESGKMSLFSFILKRHMRKAIEEWEFFLSEDGIIPRKHALLLKAQQVNPDTALEDGIKHSTSEEEIEIAEILLDIQMVPNPQVSQEALRKRPTMQQETTLCKLSSRIRGHEPSQGSITFNPSVTYGESVFASQVCSLLHLLPDHDIWTVRDAGGRIGIVCGHFRHNVYIHDPSSKKSTRIRVNNGPASLAIDDCCLSYDRNYYIKSMGSPIPVRPSPKPLLIISVDDPYKLGLDIKHYDVILSRSKNVGGPLVGYPRRGPQDLWYYSGAAQTDDMGCQDEKFRYYTDSTLSPHVRAKTLVAGDITPNALLASVTCQLESALNQYREDLTDVRTTLLDEMAKDRGKIQKYRSEEDILTLLWLKGKLTGTRSKSMKWHRFLWTFHIESCSCENPIWETFYPKDELMCYYVTGLHDLIASGKGESCLDDN